MIEREGDLFVIGRACNALCLTTNGTVRNDGCAVMGRGVARYARDNWKGVDLRLGRALRRNGNIVQKIGRRKDFTRHYTVVAFPVKRMWHENADMDLIVRSCKQLVNMTNHEDWKTVALPRPGCGNGQLLWANVKPAIESLLDDRFIIVWNGT